jgi:hypothetical protein
LEKTTIVANEKGQIEVEFDGYLYMNDWDQALFTSNLSATWPNHREITSVNMTDKYYTSTLVHRKIYQVEAGTYEVYALGKKTQGPLGNAGDGIYSTLIAHFIPDSDDLISLKSELLDQIGITTGVPKLLGQIQIEAHHPGTALIQCTGQITSSFDDRINISLVPHGLQDSSLSMLGVQSVRESDPSSYISLSGSQKLTEGIYTFDVVADFDSISTGTGTAEISGLYSVLFLADPVSTATEDVISIKQEEIFYPNPTTGILNSRELSTDNETQRTINIFNSNGQWVEQVYMSPGQNEINLGHLATGTYMLKMKNGSKESFQVMVRM